MTFLALISSKKIYLLGGKRKCLRPLPQQKMIVYLLFLSCYYFYLIPSNIFFHTTYYTSEAVSFNCPIQKWKDGFMMFNNHSYMWIVALLFVVLNCNSFLDNSCDCDCASDTYNKSNTSFSFMLLIVIAFFFLLNGNDIF